MGWLVNALHRDLGGSKKPHSSVIYSAFQGEVYIENQAVVVKTDADSDEKPTFDIDREIKKSTSPFLFLTIDLPPPPIFQDSVEKNIIPQVAMAEVLAKYDGVTTQESSGRLQRFKITRLPPFLILHIKRFTANNFVEEKNPTIVNYPLRGVDMREYLAKPDASASTLYDLVANVTHTSSAGTVREDTTWKVHVHTRQEDQADADKDRWFQIQDLIVEEINRQVVFLGESYIQIWEQRSLRGHELRLDASAVMVQPKTTRSRAATAAMGKDPLVPPPVKKAAGPGVRMGKPRVEKGDSGGFEL